MASENEHQSNEDAVYQIDEVDLSGIGHQLIELARQLHEAGQKISDRILLDESTSTIYSRGAHDEMTDEEVRSENSQTHNAFVGTLNAMRNFRREYDRWERLTAEYALTRMGYSQRDAAQALGVAASTINRWAQHPLKIEDYR